MPTFAKRIFHTPQAYFTFRRNISLARRANFTAPSARRAHSRGRKKSLRDFHEDRCAGAPILAKSMPLACFSVLRTRFVRPIRLPAPTEKDAQRRPFSPSRKGKFHRAGARRAHSRGRKKSLAGLSRGSLRCAKRSSQRACPWHALASFGRTLFAQSDYRHQQKRLPVGSLFCWCR